jgi:hypothetical protein
MTILFPGPNLTQASEVLLLLLRPDQWAIRISPLCISLYRFHFLNTVYISTMCAWYPPVSKIKRIALVQTPLFEKKKKRMGDYPSILLEEIPHLALNFT